MARLDALHKVVVLGLGHSIHHVDASLVDGKDVGRGKYPHVGRNHRLGIHPLAVARNRHISHHVDVCYMLSEEIGDSLGRFGHTFHEFLLGNIPLVVLPRSGVYPRLAYAAVGAADTDILVAAAKAALRVPFEMSKHHQRIIVGDVAAHRHFAEPLAALDWQSHGVFLVKYVNRAESPPVHF